MPKYLGPSFDPQSVWANPGGCKETADIVHGNEFREVFDILHSRCVRVEHWKCDVPSVPALCV